MQDLPAGLHEGTLVRAREATWRVASVRPFTRCALVALDSLTDTPPARRTLIAPCDRLRPLPVPRLTRAPRPVAARLVLAAIATSRPAEGLWTAGTSRIDIHPWQLAPALAVVGGATRLLLADAVGLGKTVQAGLILSELLARGLVSRALVLTPAALRETWASELTTRFGLDARVMDQAAARQFQRHARPQRNPWTLGTVLVSSIDLVKRPDVRAAIEDQALDLLIVDEAHHAAPHTDRGVLVARLARRTPWVVLLSATPHAGDPAALDWRLTLGATSGEAPMRVFRRSPADTGRASTRATRVIRVRPSAAEHDLQVALAAYTRDVCAGPLAREPGVQLLAGLLARRAASSAWAVARTLARRLASLEQGAAANEAMQPALPWEEREGEDEAPDPWLGRPALADRDAECRRLRALVTMADAAVTQPSKARCLARLLRRVGEPAVVFTEFRDTLAALAARLGPAGEVACLHGGLDVRDRSRALARFLDGTARVLLTTDVAGEGLNLQSRARLVVTVEWPWQPHRLEQRVGRVDRLGQTQRVHAVHLTARDTFEEVVAARLQSRAAAIADDWITRTTPSTVEEADARTNAHAAREAARIRHARAVLSSVRHVDGPPAWSMPRRGGLSQQVAVVCVVAGHAPGGARAWSQVVALRVAVVSGLHRPRAWRLVSRALARDPRIIAAATAAARGVPPATGWATAAGRLRAIGRTLETVSTGAVQAGLFDRRALREAEARAEVLARLRQHVTESSARLEGFDRAGHLDVRVVAILPLSDRGPA